MPLCIRKVEHKFWTISKLKRISLFRVKHSMSKVCYCKRFDKYHVWENTSSIKGDTDGSFALQIFILFCAWQYWFFIEQIFYLRSQICSQCSQIHLISDSWLKMSSVKYKLIPVTRLVMSVPSASLYVIARNILQNIWNDAIQYLSI